MSFIGRRIEITWQSKVKDHVIALEKLPGLTPAQARLGTHKETSPTRPLIRVYNVFDLLGERMVREVGPGQFDGRGRRLEEYFTCDQAWLAVGERHPNELEEGELWLFEI